MRITAQLIENGTKIISALAAIVGATMAVIGVNAWKRQMKGKTNYELARRYLKAVYKVRDSIKEVRNPFISIGEITSSLKDSGLSEDEYKDHQKSNRAVYSARWKRVVEAASELDVELLEAEVIWGKGAVDITSDFTACRRKLFVNLQMFLDGYKKQSLGNDEIIYDTGDENKFNTELIESVEKIEIYLKPFIVSK